MPSITESLDRMTDTIAGLDSDLADCRRKRTALELDAAGRTTPQPSQCAWCGKWYDAQGRYVEAPFIAINVNHGACRECYLKLIRETKAANDCTAKK